MNYNTLYPLDRLGECFGDDIIRPIDILKKYFWPEGIFQR
jgi:hypothetical protein